MRPPAFWITILVLALVPSAFVALTAIDLPHFGSFHDDSICFVCARSLAQGSGYRILSLLEQPYQTKYPPLYPLFLARIWKLNANFPDNLRFAAVFSWLIPPVYLMLAKRTFSDLGLGSTHGWVLCAVLALNPYVIFYSVHLMSELIFTCFLLASLCLAKRAGEPGSAWCFVNVRDATEEAGKHIGDGGVATDDPAFHLIHKSAAGTIYAVS